MMKGFWKNCKGAVTVFVTLLLIPAILFSGTGVDLARIYAANSVLDDAGQLAANSILTQYDALLQDIYGVYGVMSEDPILGDMLNKYIETAVFGLKGHQDLGLGTFQLVYSEGRMPVAKASVVPGQNLGQAQILRRQIEEYMKIRAPIYIVQELLDKLENNTISADIKVIEDKNKIDSGVSELFELYKKLFDAIKLADGCEDTLRYGRFSQVNNALRDIKSQFSELKQCYEDWEDVDEEEDPNGKSDLQKKYKGILGNIQSLTQGGSVYRTWTDGHEDSEGAWVAGSWSNSISEEGLNAYISLAKMDADGFKHCFDDVVSAAQAIDSKQQDLSNQLDALENKLNSGECSDDLRDAMYNPTGSDNKSQIQRYRKLLDWKATPLSVNYKTGGYEYITTFKNMLDSIRYSSTSYSRSLTRDQLRALPTNASFNLKTTVSAEDSEANYFSKFTGVEYGIPSGFEIFSERSPEHKTFYIDLERMVSAGPGEPVSLIEGDNASGDDQEKKQRKIIESLIKLVQDAYNGLTNSPEGAEYINDSFSHNPENMSILDILKNIATAVDNDIIGVFKDPLGKLGEAGDMTLLLTYDAAMFSNYTTTKPNSIGKSDEEKKKLYKKTLSGVTMSPKVNYFYQSELEYLYEGSNDAGKNLNAVTKLLFMVRLICNYISVFSVPEITNIVTSIQSAFAWCPPLALVLGELARAAFAAAETVCDVAALRSGHNVPLLKNATTWICSPTKVTGAIESLMGDNDDTSESDSEDAESDNEYASGGDSEDGISYSTYLMFFIIAKAPIYGGMEAWANELGKRTKQLIEWNIINYKGEVNADEAAMSTRASAPEAFRLDRANTGFSVKTTLDLSMLFIPRAIAPDGIVITSEVFRGY
ncbi:MAG: DUF5702 domain-containing protein [Clostridiales bacterium]|jgi:hypothetical protein|nr:DUF5702 domain-containing protein [Clostridiales bacterium]